MIDALVKKYCSGMTVKDGRYYQFGKTKIFFVKGVLELFEDARLEKFEMVRKLGLKTGDLVIDAEYMNPVWGPNAKRQWYTAMEGPRRFVVVPAKAVVHASFEMARATLEDGPKDQRAKAAVAKAAVVLLEEERELIMEELRSRDHGDEQ